MMIIDDLCILASNTARTKAYLQAMIKNQLYPNHILVYSDDIDSLVNEADGYREEAVENELYDINEPMLITIKKMRNTTYELIDEKDINSEKISDCIKSRDEKYFVYSGYGGYILKKHLFELGKRYIHVHAGVLPQYRGSTTVYYSYIKEGMLGTTAIFLSEGIDEGDVITKQTFLIPEKPVDIDYIYEPWTRSQTLIKALKELISENATPIKQGSDESETYFIIHPVLKHIALLSMEKEWRK